MPAIRHFPPPIGCAPISIDRYSPYFYASNDFGISIIRPSGWYESAFPEGANLAELAYHFEGEYASCTRTEPGTTRKDVLAWVRSWQVAGNRAARLSAFRIGEQYWLLDTRQDSCTDCFPLSMEEAEAVVGGIIWSNAVQDWAIERKYVVASIVKLSLWLSQTHVP